MIKVYVDETHISIQGHANYAPMGEDIVCAGVSALVWSLIRSMKALTKDNIKETITSGDVFITYKNVSEQGRLLIDSFFIGVSEIAKNYPDYIKIL